MSTIKVTNIQSPDSGTNDIIIDANGNVTVDPLYVDATNNRVGIGTTSPDTALHVVGAATSTQLLLTDATNATIRMGTPAAGVGILSVNTGQNLVFGHQSSAGSTYSEKVRIDSSGRLLVGTSTVPTVFGTNPLLTVASSSGFASLGRYSSTTIFGPDLSLVKSRNDSIGSQTIVQNGDQIGGVSFHGSDGSQYLSCARIEAYVDGTPGANDMPGRLVFSTTADGASSPSQRMRIIESGSIGFGNMDYLFPETDNAFSIGLSGYRWSAIWAANGTIQTSDEREKTNITDAQLGSEFIKSLRPVSYKWVKGGKVDTGERDEDNNYIYESIPGERTHWGFIAQEVKQAVDNAGVDFGGWVLTDKDDPDSQQALRYDQFIAPLTKALQETMAELEALKAEVAALKGA